MEFKSELAGVIIKEGMWFYFEFRGRDLTSPGVESGWQVLQNVPFGNVMKNSWEKRTG